MKKFMFSKFALILVLVILILGGLMFFRITSTKSQAKESNNRYAALFKDEEESSSEPQKNANVIESTMNNELTNVAAEEEKEENIVQEPINVNEEKPNEVLEKISKTFNSLDDVVSLNKQANTSLTSSSSVDSITITAKGENYNNTFVYKLSGNLLTASGSSEDTYFAMSSTYLEAAISKLYNVKPQDVYATINSEQIKDYTVENEGFSNSTTDNTVTYVLNISMPLKIIDYSNTYITESDLTPYSDMLRTPGFVQATINGITFHKQSDDYSIVISIGEENNITDKTYNSTVSFIKMIYGDEEANHFKELFHDFKGDTKFEKEKYKIQLNPKLTETEKVLTKNSNYKITRITIKK